MVSGSYRIELVFIPLADTMQHARAIRNLISHLIKNQFIAFVHWALK